MKVLKITFAFSGRKENLFDVAVLPVYSDFRVYWFWGSPGGDQSCKSGRHKMMKFQLALGSSFYESLLVWELPGAFLVLFLFKK